MTTGLDVEDRRSSVLDAFAKAPLRETLPAAVPVAASVFERAAGAQAVTVHRDEGVVLQRLKTLGAAAGQEWYYRFPVKNRRENRTDYIEGPSIKLALDLARIYGNCDVDTRVVDVGSEWLIYARFTDIESGFTLTRPFQQRKRQGSIGGGDEARALDIALQIGTSKAIRNVIVNALQTFADFAFEEARNALVEKIGKNLGGYRNRVVARLADKKIDLKRVEAVFGRTAADWLAPDIARVIAMVKSIEDGMATLDDTFPPLGKTEPEASDKKADALAEFAEGAGQKTAPAQTGGDEIPAARGPGGAPQGAGDAVPRGDQSPSGRTAAPQGGQGPTAETQPTPSQQDGTGAGQPASAPDPKKDALMHKLRAKAKRGTNALRLALRGLPEDEDVLLTDVEHEELGGIAEDADGKAEAR